ncbi:MAG: hypothetical protein HOV94_41255 [Saccharothrix sp.]|nr:hypothetical protein [Saccharothrix sp.]
MTSSALHTFRRRLSRRAFAPVDVVCVGTSTTFGSGASTVEAGFTARLGQALRTRLGVPGGGCHYLPTHPGWTRSGAWSPVGRDYGQASVALTNTAWIERSGTATSFTVLFKQGNSSADHLIVSIDGGTAVTVPVHQGVGTAYDGAWTSPALPRGPHTIRIQAPPTGTVEIGGLYAADGDETAGLRVWNGGTPAVTSAAWTPTQPAAPSHWARAGALDPALLVYMISSNDYVDQVDPATFRDNVAAAIAYARLAGRTSSVLLVHTFLRPGTGTPAHPWAEYGQRLRELAAELPDVAYLDVGPHWPVDQVADEDDLISPDNVHPTDAGHAWLADLVAEDLAAVPDPPSSTGPTPPVVDPAALSGLVAAWRADDLPQTDGAPVASWAPYAGSETAPLVQTNPARQPVVRLNVVAGRSALRLRQPVAPLSTSGPYLATPAWSAARPAPVTVLAVMRLDRTYGNAWSGISTSHLAMLILGGDMVMGMMAGASTNGQYVTTGRGRWAVYAAVYNGGDSRFWQTGSAVQTVPTASHAAAGLSGLTLGANASGGNTANLDIAELFVFGRALTDTEARGCLDVLARRYGIDRVGRTSV